jgi:hypothetical protein
VLHLPGDGGKHLLGKRGKSQKFGALAVTAAVPSRREQEMPFQKRPALFHDGKIVFHIQYAPYSIPTISCKLPSFSSAQ